MLYIIALQLLAADHCVHNHGHIRQWTLTHIQLLHTCKACRGSVVHLLASETVCTADKLGSTSIRASAKGELGTGAARRPDITTRTPRGGVGEVYGEPSRHNHLRSPSHDGSSVSSAVREVERQQGLTSSSHH